MVLRRAFSAPTPRAVLGAAAGRQQQTGEDRCDDQPGGDRSEVGGHGDVDQPDVDESRVFAATSYGVQRALSGSLGPMVNSSLSVPPPGPLPLL